MRQHKENTNSPIKRKTMARKQTANTIIDTTKETHAPKNNGLKVKIDDLRTFEPLTDNQNYSLMPTNEVITLLHCTELQVQARHSVHYTRR